jgi:23S rRNA (guanine745-N1)-methyltransferase
MLADVVRYLRCPLCHGGLTGTDALRCGHGHSFDVARQGYVNLLVGRPPDGSETPEMVSAREEIFAAGHFDAVTEAVVAHVPADCALVVDAGSGPGHYLAAALGRPEQAHGLALDIAKPAVRRAARAHPRIGAAVVDVWRGLPVIDGCADVVLNVFAPRNPEAFRRVLRPSGVLVVVTPQPDHLTELVHGLGLLGVDPDKDRRLDASLGGGFRPLHDQTVVQRLALSHSDAVRLAAMGPSAFHTSLAELADRVAGLPEPLSVTISARVRAYRPQPL